MSKTSTQTPENEFLEIYGAREHNLKNFDLKIPRNQLVVITGISGSGKSSLAFDTIYAEGQRRYMESFSAYARSFIGGMERPDVDKINGLSPVISIEQKTTSKNPRSTVGTATEIYDYMRLLYARAAKAYSYVTGEEMIKQSEEQVLDLIFKQYHQQKIQVLAPVVKGRKGHYRELFVQLRKKGYNRVRIDGELTELTPDMQLDRYKVHDIEIVVDRLALNDKDFNRLKSSVKTAMKEGKGVIMVLDEQDTVRHYSRFLMCPSSGLAYDEPAPNLFSFNSPYGMCKKCKGMGEIREITQNSIIPDPSLSISQGGISPLGEFRDIWLFKKIEAILKAYKFDISTPINKLSDEVMQVILHGAEEDIAVDSKKHPGTKWYTSFEGVINFLERHHQNTSSDKIRAWVDEYTEITICPDCEGGRLNKEALHYRIGGTNIAYLSKLDVSELYQWFEDVDQYLDNKQKQIASEIIRELKKRLGFLINIGLDYLTLNRPLRTLSGGEAQRIRLATQIGSQLVGVLYILDEPSIGLHQRDNYKLIQALKALRDVGNSVIVVEHDKDMMLDADYLVDIGPGAGIHGGSVVAAGTPKQVLDSGSLTSNYLSGHHQIEIPQKRREGNGKSISLSGLRGNNLQNVAVSFPLGKLICVTGVSGSGKSTVIHETLYPILSKHFYKSKKMPLPYEEISGLEHIDKVIEVDQSPIGRTPRSNPATYTGVFSDIRSLYASLPEAKIRGYKPGRFSFNVKAGRCETCEGAGKKVIEMDFLPDVYVDCESCKGKRYKRETLEVRFKGKSISDVLEMTVDNAVVFFENQPKIVRKIKTLQDVGLGYITLGQHATTLSGGEAQRVKLASELSRKDTGKTFYILDEPTTGLHFQDIKHLLDVLQKLVDKGNTVLIIEHNLDIVKVADHIIDMGPEGGKRGGNRLFEGTPEELIKLKDSSHTAKFLAMEM